MLSLLRDEVCHRRSRAWCSRAGYTPLTRRAGRSRRRTSCAAVIALCMAVDLLTLPLGALAQTSAGARVPRAGALNPGDVVRITVWRKPELSGEFVITADGTVSHPLYRDVRVTGLPLDAVDARIREFLGKLEANPQFVIAPLLRVAVGGEVRLPNLYTLGPETSLAQAVAMAGGPTDRGRRDRVRLIRQDREMVVDLRRADALGAGMVVNSGDQIVVERRRELYRDVLSPVVSVMGATAAIVSMVLYWRNR